MANRRALFRQVLMAESVSARKRALMRKGQKYLDQQHSELETLHRRVATCTGTCPHKTGHLIMLVFWQIEKEDFAMKRSKLTEDQIAFALKSSFPVSRWAMVMISKSTTISLA